MKAPVRPVLRYFGGKWMLAPKIVRHLPQHKLYVEPYGGAASVLLRKPRAFAEVYNDIDDEVVNLFGVLRNRLADGTLIAGAADALVDALRLTPFSRTEYEASKFLDADPVERARRLVVRSFQGHGPDATNMNSRTGFRADSFGSNRSAPRDWAGFPDTLKLIVRRLADVEIESIPAVDLIQRFNQAHALFYVDPPYPWETRTKRRGAGGRPANGYLHEMTDEDHAALLDVLVASKAMIVLSGYDCDLYRERLGAWQQIKIDAMADGARPRVESLWLNPRAVAAQSLFRSAP